MHTVSTNRISTLHGIENADDEMANVKTAYAQKVAIGVSWVLCCSELSKGWNYWALLNLLWDEFFKYLVSATKICNCILKLLFDQQIIPRIWWVSIHFLSLSLSLSLSLFFSLSLSLSLCMLLFLSLTYFAIVARWPNSCRDISEWRSDTWYQRPRSKKLKNLNYFVKCSVLSTVYLCLLITLTNSEL